MEYALEQARRKEELGDKLTSDSIIQHGGCSCKKCSSKLGFSSSSSGGGSSSGTGGGCLVDIPASLQPVQLAHCGVFMLTMLPW